jgi:hypothetical protein
MVTAECPAAAENTLREWRQRRRVLANAGRPSTAPSARNFEHFSFFAPFPKIRSSYNHPPNNRRYLHAQSVRDEWETKGPRVIAGCALLFSREWVPPRPGSPVAHFNFDPSTRIRICDGLVSAMTTSQAAAAVGSPPRPLFFRGLPIETAIREIPHDRFTL